MSVVPTQLRRWLGSPGATALAARLKAVLVGGAPASPDLLKAAFAAGFPLRLSYGMTETASQIATTPTYYPEDERFSCGRVLPSRMVVEGGRELVVVMRSHGAVAARTMDFGVFNPRTLPVRLPVARLLVRSNGQARARLELANGEGWSEHVFRIPAEGVSEGRTVLQLTGRYASFRYWFYQ